MRLENKVAVITGAGGTLCSVMTKDLAGKGMRVALLGRTLEKLKRVEAETGKSDGSILCLTCDVTRPDDVQKARDTIVEKLGIPHILVNGAGGNNINAVTTLNAFDPVELENHGPSIRGFFNLDDTIMSNILHLNTMGTVIPCRIFGRDMAQNNGGSIINFASMNTYRPLTRNAAYAMAKAAIANFTQWLAVYLAPANIRVNAIAPGFFLNERSRKILLTPDEKGLTDRGQNVMHHTPLKRFGEAAELLGCLHWLIDDKAAGFVTGITIPVDGGFTACSGV